jgi:hypothetical protein
MQPRIRQILFTRPGVSNEALLAPFTLVMVSIASNRILLNMRSVPVSAAEPSFPHKIGSGNRSRAEQQFQVGAPFSGITSITPVTPVHHPQYPEGLSVKVSDQGSEYELEKMTV